MPPIHSAALVSLLPLLAFGREITFPPLSGYRNQQVPVQQGSDFGAAGNVMNDDISGAKFAGLSTFANLPYVHCLAADGAGVEKFDIAFLGAPFDTVSGFFYHSRGFMQALLIEIM